MNTEGTFIDIIAIDAKIRENFSKEKNDLCEYKNMLNDIVNYIKLNSLNNRIANDLEKSRLSLVEKIRKIESGENFDFYTVETFDILSEYRKILETPIKMNFNGKIIKNTETENCKEEIIHRYLEVAQKYTNVNDSTNKRCKMKCDNCSNMKNFKAIDSNIYMCLECFSQQTIFRNITSYKDIDRVNMSSKYTYDRKVHFRDCINQYQGKGFFEIFNIILSILYSKYLIHFEYSFSSSLCLILI